MLVLGILLAILGVVTWCYWVEMALVRLSYEWHVPYIGLMGFIEIIASLIVLKG